MLVVVVQDRLLMPFSIHLSVRKADQQMDVRLKGYRATGIKSSTIHNKMANTDAHATTFTTLGANLYNVRTILRKRKALQDEKLAYSKLQTNSFTFPS